MNRQQRPRDGQSYGPVTQQKCRLRLWGEERLSGRGEPAQGEELVDTVGPRTVA